MNFLLRIAGGYIMKKMLLSWIIPSVVDMLLSALVSLSSKTESDVDDALVRTLSTERDVIITEIKKAL